ncbi:hypothetical protein SAY87_006673 [Trapa incisa]|uniref:RING-type domain-containing protein n=1 Tax=Trapa incisa TaxID=236973 RepID=A0AAN7JYZ9_9MYRT|nr:hypothetical protein SAY87_006673 [Trapa incisa]
MSTQAVKTTPLRAYCRSKTELNLDLNTPPIENPYQEGTSNQVISQQMVNSIATIDLETIDDDDDDIVVCSHSAFAEAKNKSQRKRGRACIVDVDAGEEMENVQKRRRGPTSEPLIEFYDFINLKCSRSSLVPEKKPSLPEDSSFSCPICMGPLVEETSTRCGHIFCKACIRTAITAQPKCPTCRKKVTVRGLIRVFLPATNSI